jgi:hypothetical protein
VVPATISPWEALRALAPVSVRVKVHFVPEAESVHQSRRALITAAAAVVAALAVAIPIVVSRGVAGATTDTTTAASTPTGGPRAIQTLSPGSAAHLLDTAAGDYRKLPYLSVVLSPDEGTVTDGRIGVADRAALLRHGERAIHRQDH